MKSLIEKIQDLLEKLPYWLARPFQILLWRIWTKTLK